MKIFDVGETIICSIEVKDDNGALKNPETSMKISIYNIINEAMVDNQDMVEDEKGKYHYDYTLSDIPVPTGIWWAKYTATDGSRITIQWEKFEVTTR